MSAFSLRVLLLAALKRRGDSGRRLPSSHSEAANVPAAQVEGKETMTMRLKLL